MRDWFTVMEKGCYKDSSGAEAKNWLLDGDGLGGSGGGEQLVSR